MKILMLCDFFGDNQTYQENLLLKYYKKLGHEVVILASTMDSILDYYSDNYDANQQPKTYTNSEGGKIYRLPYSINFKNRLRKFGGVLQILEQEKPDLIYCHGIHLNLKEAVKYKSKNKETKIILDSHADFTNSANNWVSKKILNGFIRRLFLSKYKKNISKFYAVVPESKKFMIEMYGIKENLIDIIPLGCDYEYMQELKKEIDFTKIKEHYNIEDGDFLIMSGGKFQPPKKTEVLIEAVKNIVDKKIKLILFGTPDKKFGDYYKYLEEISKVGNINFVGWLSPDRIYDIMAISNLAVFPGSQSVLWQQSIGMSLPVIAGDNGGQDMSYLNVNDNLIKVDNENINPSYFENLIRNLIDNPKKLEQMRIGAEKTAKEFLNYRSIAEKTLEVTK